MESGLSQHFTDRTNPIQRHMDNMVELGADPALVQPYLNQFTSDVIKIFAYAAREYMDKHKNVSFEDLVKIAYKNRMHGQHNPRASIQKPTSMASIGDKKRMLSHPITAGMSAMTSDGGAAAIVCSQDFVVKHNLESKAIEILAQNMLTDLPSSFRDSYMDTAGCGMAKRAAEKCYQDSGLTADNVDVFEVHDCFSCNELFMYEALQMAPVGKGIELFNKGKWTRNRAGGEVYKMADKWVVNPSGGLVSKGHPIGATGITTDYDQIL